MQTTQDRFTPCHVTAQALCDAQLARLPWQFVEAYVKGHFCNASDVSRTACNSTLQSPRVHHELVSCLCTATVYGLC